VQVEAADAVPAHQVVGHLVELLDPLSQPATQRAGQPEDPTVVMEAHGQHGGSGVAQPGHHRVIVLAERDRVEVRAQGVVHAHHQHRHIRAVPHRAGQLAPVHV
jgi:hypothetical protein